VDDFLAALRQSRQHGYTLVTHNRADFCDIAGLEIVSAA
jgi:hypothetical protein